MNFINFQTLESSERLNNITRESWFITTAVGNIIRRTVYKVNAGQAVAFQDSGEGVDTSLYVEGMFYELNKTEDDWLQIQCDSGVYSLDHIKVFFLR